MKKQILFLTMIALIPSIIDSADRDSDYAEPSAPLNRPVSTKKKSWWNKLSPQARAGIIAGGAVAGTALAAGGAAAGYHFMKNQSNNTMPQLQLDQPPQGQEPSDIQFYQAMQNLGMKDPAFYFENPGARVFGEPQ